MSSILKKLNFFLFFSQVFLGSISFAQTISGISGVSRESVIEGKTVKIYAGWANPSACTTRDGVNPCDSCSGGDNVPCNHTSIYDTLVLQIDVQSTTASIANLPVQISAESDGGTLISSTITTTATSTGYSMKILWSSLCPGLTLDTSCSNSGTVPASIIKTFYFGPYKDGKFVEAITVEASISTFGSTANTYTDCVSGDTTGNVGAACYFKMYGGDEKIYVDVFEPSWSIDAPAITVGSSTLPVKKVVFFAAPSASVGDDSNAYSSIRNSSDFFELDIQAGEDPLADNRLIGFDNGSRYCFRMATMDNTGNIQGFTPTFSSDYCAEANEVLGLLHDKKCFIASAAFGSPLNRYVQRFREFRDRYLLPSSIGKKFVETYYQYGPALANSIHESERMRALTRGVLWPLLFYVEIFLQFGIFWGLFSLLFSFLILRRVYQQIKIKIMRPL